MTVQEFSNEFDVLYNNIMSNQAPGLDEYEKSVFLTKAQNEILLSYFDPKLNKSQVGFDGSEKRLIDFSNIIEYAKYTPYSSNDYTNSTKGNYIKQMSDGYIAGTSCSKRFEKLMMYYTGNPNSPTKNYGPEIFIIINEWVMIKRDNKDIRLTVLPLSYRELDLLMSKPFKHPAHYQAWRFFVNLDIEIIMGPNDNLDSYNIRYIRKPKPIILIDLTSSNLSIDRELAETECELDPLIHKEILQRAVELAKAAYTGDLLSQISLGSMSETNMGFATTGTK